MSEDKMEVGKELKEIARSLRTTRAMYAPRIPYMLEDIERLEHIIDKYFPNHLAGKWIAHREGTYTIVGTGETKEEALDSASKEGYTKYDITLFKVPEAKTMTERRNAIPVKDIVIRNCFECPFMGQSDFGGSYCQVNVINNCELTYSDMENTPEWCKLRTHVVQIRMKGDERCTS